MTDVFRDHLIEALGNNYTLDRELTGGGMSRVFVAREHSLNRTVVVKVLRPDLAVDVNRERFRREIILAAQLQHPLIVPVLSAGEHHELLWYTMPYVEGESLREEIRRGEPASARSAMRVLHDVLDALGYAHARGVIHRDIKPGNILRHGNHSLITDFGVAKALSAALPSSGTTSAGIAIGTPAYMAPEQLAADPKADHRMDIYAVGLLIYELLTGTQAFAESSPQATMAAQLTRMPRDLAEVRSDVPAPLSSLVMRMLAKNPDDRPQSALVALNELDAIATPAGTSAPSGRVLLPTPASSRGRRLLLATAVLAALVVVGALTLTNGDSRRSLPTPRPDSSTVAARTKPPPPSSAPLRPAPAVAGTAIKSGGGAASIAGTKGTGSGSGTGTAAPSPQAKTASTKSAATKTTTTKATTTKTAATPPRPPAPLLNRKVAILPFRVATNRPQLADAAQALQDSLRNALTAAGYTLANDSELLRLVSQQNMVGGGMRRLAESGGIGALVSVDIVGRSDEVQAISQVIDVWRSQTAADREAADADKPMELLGLVRNVGRALDRVSWRSRSDPKRVIVFETTNNTGIDSLGIVARQLDDSLRAAATRAGTVPMPLDSTLRETTDPTERRTLAIRRAAGAIATGSISRLRADSVVVRFSVRDMSEERNFPTVEARVPVSTLPTIIPLLAARFGEFLGQVNWGPKVVQ